MVTWILGGGSTCFVYFHLDVEYVVMIHPLDSCKIYSLLADIKASRVQLNLFRQGCVICLSSPSEFLLL